MISTMTKTLILSACLLVAGVTSANPRPVMVPVVSAPAHEHRAHPHGHPTPPRHVVRHQPVAYVVAKPRHEIRRFDPPSRGHVERHHGKAHAHGFDHRRGESRR
ncbi:hypothetical protein G7009_16120 [Pseudomonas capeferrum]|uniref:hypothetical protein n=1 Tax=Pseudomonas capeferrum TaxID=1495066 RepID=UPI0015E37798|nr:hypothetical protein [Pseudomonas capeferrum]MBA1203259.1 hypothetical protein [Pseudomonas capeferrum]